MSESDRFARRGERRIHWDSEGEGEPLLLLPGLGGGARTFGTLPRRFARAGRRALTYDPVGIPPSTPLEGPFRFEDAARDVLAVLDDAGIARVDLVGTSLGGKVALAVALSAPERVRRLVMLASHAVVTPRTQRVYRFFLAAAETVPAERFGELVAPFLFGATFHRERSQMVEEILRASRPAAATRELMIAQARALLASTSPLDLGSVQTPTLCIAGREDTLTLEEDVRASAASIRDARYLAIERAGHSVLLESTATFDAIVEFLTAAAA
jgi:pimeloyl-ACP methyl ester carboxylesterase